MNSIKEAVASVQNAPGSMYTREDVISLLTKLESAIPPPYEYVGLSESQIRNLINNICDQIKDNADDLQSGDVVDLSSAEFELNGNEIELSCVNLDTDAIAGEVLSGIADVIEEFFEEFKKD